MEYLEEQQEQLSSGLITMYRLLKESNITTIPPLPEKPQAQDLLVALRGLRLDKPPPPQPSSQHHRHTNGSIMDFTDDGTPPEPTPPDHMMQSYFDAASRSPLQPSMFVPSFPPVPATRQASNAPAIPTSMSGSFTTMPYPTFDYTRTTHAPMHAQPDHTFSPMHAHSPVFGQLQANGNGITSTSADSWHGSHDPSTSPTITTHMSPRSSAPSRSPRSVDEGCDRNNNERPHHHHHHQQQQQQYWNWPEAGFYGNGEASGMAGTGLAGAHDLGLRVGMESIESRTCIGPHDSQAG